MRLIPGIPDAQPEDLEAVFTPTGEEDADTAANLLLMRTLVQRLLARPGGDIAYIRRMSTLSLAPRYQPGSAGISAWDGAYRVTYYHEYDRARDEGVEVTGYTDTVDEALQMLDTAYIWSGLRTVSTIAHVLTFLDSLRAEVRGIRSLERERLVRLVALLAERPELTGYRFYTANCALWVIDRADPLDCITIAAHPQSYTVSYPYPPPVKPWRTARMEQTLRTETETLHHLAHLLTRRRDDRTLRAE